MERTSRAPRRGSDWVVIGVLSECCDDAGRSFLRERLTLAEDGEPVLDHEPPLRVELLVDADLGTRRYPYRLVEDRIAYDGALPDQHVVHQHGVLDECALFDADGRRQHRPAYLAAGDDDPR